jgi:hypothetical protein
VTHWNYRLLSRKYPSTYVGYDIYEVYYSSEDDSVPIACSKEPETPGGDSPKDVKKILRLMAAGAKKPVLEYESIGTHEFKVDDLVMVREDLKTVYRIAKISEGYDEGTGKAFLCYADDSGVVHGYEDFRDLVPASKEVKP